MRKSFVALLLAFSICGKLAAHELRPGYLGIREEKRGEFSVVWKTPARGEVHLSLVPLFGARTENITPMSTLMTDTAAIQTWHLRALEPLRGTTIRIGGLEGTLTDALVHLEFADGTDWTQRLTPGEPSAVIPRCQSPFGVAGVYLELGVEHILTGIDHLLFILALIIITRGGWKLVKTVTAFTVSHSITLTAATLGFVHVPQRPVEAVIALSIVFVACEIVHRRQGRSGLTERWPWIVALSFGLLHGLGFAGALSEVGLPQGNIPLALLFFSVGIEVGQLLFISVVLAFVAVVSQIRLSLPRWADLAPPYAIGIIAMFWVIQRVALF
jgi:hydrogenase/urease accessory protein HupE